MRSMGAGWRVQGGSLRGQEVREVTQRQKEKTMERVRGVTERGEEVKEGESMNTANQDNELSKLSCETDWTFNSNIYALPTKTYSVLLQQENPLCLRFLTVLQ